MPDFSLSFFSQVPGKHVQGERYVMGAVCCECGRIVGHFRGLGFRARGAWKPARNPCSEYPREAYPVIECCHVIPSFLPLPAAFLRGFSRCENRFYRPRPLKNDCAIEGLPRPRTCSPLARPPPVKKGCGLLLGELLGAEAEQLEPAARDLLPSAVLLLLVLDGGAGVDGAGLYNVLAAPRALAHYGLSGTCDGCAHVGGLAVVIETSMTESCRAFTSALPSAISCWMSHHLAVTSAPRISGGRSA